MFVPYKKKFNGINADERLFLQMKKQKEGKNYAQAKYEVRKTTGVVIRNELQAKAKIEEDKVKNVGKNFKLAFTELLQTKSNRTGR